MDFQSSVYQFRPPRFSFPRRTIVFWVLGAIALLFLMSIWFTVEPEEAGLVLRFGRFVRQVPSGLHMKFPYPIETIVKVPIERQLKEEFGFRTEQADVRTAYSEKDFESEAMMLTGDLNVAVVEWTAQYRVND